MDSKLKTISLFSGCGGMDLGFSLEGFEIIYALDHDFTSIESHRKNFQGIAVNKDIVEIDFSTLNSSNWPNGCSGSLVVEVNYDL